MTELKREADLLHDVIRDLSLIEEKARDNHDRSTEYFATYAKSQYQLLLVKNLEEQEKLASDMYRSLKS